MLLRRVIHLDHRNKAACGSSARFSRRLSVGANGDCERCRSSVDKFYRQYFEYGGFVRAGDSREIVLLPRLRISALEGVRAAVLAGLGVAVASE
jgi:DNA-binding transcriptional LysR family regulator